MTRWIGYCLLVSSLIGAGFWSYQMRRAVKPTTSTDQLSQIVRVSNEKIVDCSKIVAERPIVILAIGQSNAANHGAKSTPFNQPILLFSNGKCIMAADPLPGGTGSGGSIWSRLPGYLGVSKTPILMSVLGVDSTAIADWTVDQSPLKLRLVNQVKSMKDAGFLPQVILWQQGEADAQLGTTLGAYSSALDILEINLTQAGTDAIIVSALSTVCRSSPNHAIRAAIRAKAKRSARFKVGPDTDTLVASESRTDGCHFSSIGLEQAAQLWAKDLRHIFASI